MKPKLSPFTLFITFGCLSIVAIFLIPKIKIEGNVNVKQQLNISYSWPDVSARVVEAEVTSKLEGLFQTVAGIENISSVSHYGSGRIDIEFKSNCNIDKARLEIASLIRQTYSKLPAEVSYPFLFQSFSGSNTPTITYSISSNYSSAQIIKIVNSQITPFLNEIVGIDKIQILGSVPQEWEVSADPAMLASLELEVGEVLTKIRSYFKKDFLGKTEYDEQQGKLTLQTNLVFQVNNGEDLNLADVPLKKIGNRVIYLKDIAIITYKEQSTESYYRMNGLNTISLIIFPSNEISILKLTGEVSESMEKLEKKIPAGIQLKLVHDSTEQFRTGFQNTLSKLALFFFLCFIIIILSRLTLKSILLLLVSVAVTGLLAAFLVFIFQIDVHLDSYNTFYLALVVSIYNNLQYFEYLKNKNSSRILKVIVIITVILVCVSVGVYFLKENQSDLLVDILVQISIFLVSSIATNSLLIPALARRLSFFNKANVGLETKDNLGRYKTPLKRIVIGLRKLKWGFISFLVLVFGLPVQLIPEKLTANAPVCDFYNRVEKAIEFNTLLRPVLNNIFGGTLRWFSQNSYHDIDNTENSRPTLFVKVRMPDGTTIEQIDETVRKVEHTLVNFKELELFHTSITGSQNANIQIRFKPQFEKTDFPYLLKTKLQNEITNLAGADWSIYGVGQAFVLTNNEGYRSNRITIHGYNYDDLYYYCEVLKSQLSDHPRVSSVSIEGSDNWDERVRNEYLFERNPSIIELYNLSLNRVFDESTKKYKVLSLANLNISNRYSDLKLRVASDDDIWSFNKNPSGWNRSIAIPLSALGTVKRAKTGNSIHKKNQEYQLVVTYDFIGSELATKKFREEEIKKISNILPLGYKVSKTSISYWEVNSRNFYSIIFFVLLTIFFVSTVFFESLRQTLFLIVAILFGFVGIFFLFRFGSISYNQGVFTAFILLPILSIIPGLSIVAEFNDLRKKYITIDKETHLITAYHNQFKGLSISLLAIIAGLAPFIFSDSVENFWYSLASCLIAGLLFSFFGLFIAGAFVFPFQNRKNLMS